MAELRECPFCEGKVELGKGYHREGRAGKQDYYYAECTVCSAQSDVRFVIDDESFARQKVISLWNARASEPEPRALTLEELISSMGKPIWWKDVPCDTPYDECGQWIILNLNEIPRPWYTYGKTWIAYDKKPKGE